MAMPTTVNDQITDSVTQANVKVLGDAPAMAMGNLFATTAQALSNAAHNATSHQQQSYVAAQAATTQAVAMLLAGDPASAGEMHAHVAAAAQVAGSDSAAEELRRIIRDTTEDVLGASGDFAYGIRATMDATAAALDELNDTAYEGLLRIIRLAATAACLNAMIKSPEQSAAYSEVLEIIRKLG